MDWAPVRVGNNVPHPQLQNILLVSPPFELLFILTPGLGTSLSGRRCTEPQLQKDFISFSTFWTPVYFNNYFSFVVVLVLIPLSFSYMHSNVMRFIFCLFFHRLSSHFIQKLLVKKRTTPAGLCKWNLLRRVLKNYTTPHRAPVYFNNHFSFVVVLTYPSLSPMHSNVMTFISRFTFLS